MRIFTAAVVSLAMAGLVAAAEPNVFPYEEFSKIAEKMTGEKVDGILMVPAYIKAAQADAKLDPAQANFRIRAADGSTQSLKCDVLPATPEEAARPVDKRWIGGGFTHKLWIPKDPEKYKGAALLNDLPAGFLMIQFPPPSPAASGQ